MKPVSALAAAALALAAPAVFAQGMQYSAPAPERKIESPRPDAPKVETRAGESVRSAIEAPKPRCEDPGPFPGRVGMQTEDRRNKFIKAVESYRACMIAFIEDRKKSLEVNQAAANEAVAELNARMKRITDEQEKMRE